MKKKIEWGVLLVENEQINAAQNTPTEKQKVVLDSYCENYLERMGFNPEGLHYLPQIGAIWIPKQGDPSLI